MIKTLETLGKAWKISFELTLYGTIENWGSIIHFTLGEDNGKYGDRNPAVWTNPGTTKLHIASGVNGNKNYYINTDTLPLNKKMLIEIEQIYLQDNTYQYNIYIDSKQIHSRENKDARSFEDIKVYIADPWSQPANGLVENIKIEDNGTVSCSA